MPRYTKKTEEASKAETPVKAKKSFEATDAIKCHSVTQGKLFVDGPRTKTPYEFVDYGAEVDVTYNDLSVLVATKSDYIFHPYFVVDNLEFIKEFPQLDKFYSQSYRKQDLLDILTMPVDEMIEEIKGLPAGAVENVKNLAATQVANGELDSVKKIKALDNYFETDLNLMADLIQN